MDATARAREIDAQFADVDRRDRFEIPQGVCYLDGNSLGALPRQARESLETATRDEWGQGLIRSWNQARWIDLPQRVGDRIATLLGAPQGTTLAADSTSLNLYKVLHAALQLRPDRTVIVTELGNFPTDLYIVDAVAREHGCEVRAVEREAIAAALDDQVAVMTMTHVDYRSAAMADMHGITRATHAVGALAVWDLAHSAGAVPVDLTGADVDFAVGCGYKYLNGGPGAPAFLYVAPRHLGTAQQPLAGWHGHAAPFAFEPGYRPAVGIDQFLVGTPPILGMRALEGALHVFDGVDVARLHAKSLAMADLFHALADEVLVPRGFGIASHRDAASRGSHVALSHPQGYALVQALIARGIIGDFRRPDVLRFGFAPLYNTAADVVTLVEALVELIDTDAYDHDAAESAVV